MLDESKVTIEPESAMYSFGEKGELLPENAIHSFDKVAAYFDKKAFAKLKSDASLEKKAMEWVASLNLDDEKKSGFAVTTIYNHLRQFETGIMIIHIRQYLRVSILQRANR